MILRRKSAPPLTLWCAAGPAQLRALAEVGWRSFPQTDLRDTLLEAFRLRDDAVRLARTDLVAAEDEGSVVVFDVAADVVDWPGVHAEGERLRIPKGRRLTKSLVGDINEEAQYQRGVEQAQVDAVQDAFGWPVPQAWREMVTASGWLRRGWMLSGAYVELHPPADAIRVTREWTGEMIYHPGVLVIGSDGADRRLAVDLREDDPAVHLVEPSSVGWDDTVVQAPSVRVLAHRLETGDFGYLT
jgi:hypothetical protein